jgi:hypothetical protein
MLIIQFQSFCLQLSPPLPKKHLQPKNKPLLTCQNYFHYEEQQDSAAHQWSDGVRRPTCISVIPVIYKNCSIDYVDKTGLQVRIRNKIILRYGLKSFNIRNVQMFNVVEQL